MDLKFIFTFIAIVFAIVSMGYSERICIQQLVCGNDGKIYPNTCAIDDAAKLHPGLRQAPIHRCPQLRTLSNEITKK